jgi:hypothetical protein
VAVELYRVPSLEVTTNQLTKAVAMEPGKEKINTIVVHNEDNHP